MPHEVIFFGVSLLAVAALATFLVTVLVRWGQRPLPFLTPANGPWSRFKRLLPTSRVAT